MCNNMKLDARDIHAIAADLVAHRRPADHERFFQLLREVDLYVPVQPGPTFVAPPAGTYVEGANHDLIWAAAKLENDERKWTPLYLDPHDPRIEGDPAIGVGAHDAFRVALLRTDFAGILLHPRGEGAFMLDRAYAERILNDYLS